MEKIQVKAVLVQHVDVPVAARLCEDFLDWLDNQGFKLVYESGLAVKDERDHEELAGDFLVEYG